MLDTGPPKLDVRGGGGIEEGRGAALALMASAYARSAGGTDSGASVGREARSGEGE